MKLIIAEKPSVAIDTAKAISSKFQKKNGYIEAGEYTITWAVGHLLEIDDSKVKGLKSKSGNKFDALIGLDNGKIKITSFVG